MQLDVAFLLDVSGSEDEVSHLVIDLARQAIVGLPVGVPGRHDDGGVRVAVVTYNNVANVSFYLSNYTTTYDVLNALVYLQTGKVQRLLSRAYFISIY